MRINYISAFDKNDMAGGWNGTNGNVYRQLNKEFDVNYVDPNSPPMPFTEQIANKFKAAMGLKESFISYHPKRLSKIKFQYVAASSIHRDLDHFHGATPWIHCEPNVPYSVYIDATFDQYVDHYTVRKRFRTKDLQRIRSLEANFLRNASVRFFGSKWAMSEAIKSYALPLIANHVVYTGGKVPLPDTDRFSGGRKFLFISLDFERKGGYLAVEAITAIRERKFEDAELVILGEMPPKELLDRPGISYGGHLRKSRPDQLAEFCDHLASARGLIHPTSQDTMGSVLIEAAYFGCPAITTRCFGVPEFVRHNETGILLDAPISRESLIAAVESISSDSSTYTAMRKAAFSHAQANLSWDALGQRMASTLRDLVKTI